MRKYVAVLLVFFTAPSTYSQTSEDLTFSRNARTFETQHSSLIVKGMANACLTVASIPDGLPCNPALTPLNKRPNIGAELLLSNGYSALTNVQSLLNGTVNDELVDTLFSKGKIIQIEANIDINFQSRFLNAQYTPITLKGFSVVRNEANPDVQLYAVEEKGFLFQSGYELFKGFYAGAQARIVNRKFIRQRFKLVELATDTGKEKIKAKEQTATYIEPGFSYFFDTQWKLKISMFLANVGFYSKEYEELKTPVDPQFGLGISPPIGWGELNIQIEYKSLNYEEKEFSHKLHLGTLYHFGSMYLSGGIDGNGVSAGVYYGLDKINAGILYSTTQLTNQDENFYTQTVYVQLGWQI